MKWKDLSLKERKQIYDSVRVNNPGATYFDIKEQFDSIPAYEDGGKSIVDEVNKSDANFVQRLKSPTRQTIPNWEDQYRVLPWEKSVSTHKLSVWDNANGGGTIVPDVQEVNGKLIDFTRPPYNNRAAVENALKTGDYVDLPKFEDAVWYTENYKRYYPRFEDGGKNKNVPVLPKELGLTPGTPEYLERQKRISGSANVIPSYKDGGIHIKKKNRGKFNALKKRTGKSTEELTHSKNPLTRKRAIFAQNAAKWNHKGRKKK